MKLLLIYVRICYYNKVSILFVCIITINFDKLETTQDIGECCSKISLGHPVHCFIHIGDYFSFFFSLYITGFVFFVIITFLCDQTSSYVKKEHFCFNFTLYPLHSKVDRANLVLRHFVPHFTPNFLDIGCWVAELNAALCVDTRAKKWKYECK